MLRELTLLGLGAGLMYYFDPERGRARRARVRDQLDHTVREVDHVIEVTTRDLSHRVQGLVHDLQGGLTTPGPVPDRVLVERIRSRMGRVVSHPRAIHITADNGHVALYGQILTAEAEPLFDVARSTPGVQSVDNHLEMHDEPGKIAALQGGRTRTGPRGDFFQETWSPSTRFLVGSAAAGMVWKLAGRRSPIRPLMLIAGAGLAARAAMLNDWRLDDVLNDLMGRVGDITHSPDRAEAPAHGEPSWMPPVT